ncbi:MAG: selenocysteine-specific translation elongation factor [Acidobacteria bacterium]|nr:selenocysteine-specific translation elongation factor [Acidobacteriota bacterium]
MRHVVVGTAGHIDHGKSSLVRALTGIDPDRLKEEKARGITIDLGFAHAEIDGIQIGFVDVPGHERFVKNMLAGVGGIDFVLMVEAADESVMPQTREHFDICRLLGIRAGLVAITKIDLVEPDLVELVRQETQELVQGSFLEGAPVLPVSTRTGQGLEELRQALGRMALEVPERPVHRILRLPIDRSFSMRGFGTVVTGTLQSGTVRREDEVELLPGGLAARIRGVQVHGRSAVQAVAGQRTAVNLQGVDLGQVRRGMVLTAPRLYRTTQVLDVRVSLLPGSRPLRNLLKVRFHHGTAEVLARVALLDADVLEPGSTAFAQLRLDSPIFCLHGDPFILRQFSPTVTIGGGRVLNPHPAKHRRRDRSAVAVLRQLASADLAQAVPLLVASQAQGWISIRELGGFTDRPLDELERVCRDLAGKGAIVLVPGPTPLLLQPATADALEKEALSLIDRYHREVPLSKGISREELRMRVFDRFPAEVFRYCLEALAAEKKVTLQEDIVGSYGRDVQLPPESRRIMEMIEQAHKKAGYQPPSLADLQGAPGEDPDEVRRIYHWMLKEKILVKISDEIAYHRDTLEAIKETIHSRFARGDRFGVSAFKELFDLTRKHAIPLLEHLDRERFTRRSGNDRILV